MADLIPVAQYLRMSTDHQQYSLENQASVIQKYAEAGGFIVIQTYSDAARSGVSLKRRTGLRQLLKDVVEGSANYRAILAYDVSRWGRFQDTDESAHYEFLCKSAGIPVHYCAEQFANDGSLPSLIMKALKRTMAGEYSRELSVKVRAGQLKLAKLGYKMGGHTPFGLRRQLLDMNGRPKQILAYGERKSIANEHVILVPGPEKEVATVIRIFREFADEHKGPTAIAKGLNEDGIRFVTGSRWDVCTVINVLKNPKYLGMQIWGRTSAFLSGPIVPIPEEQWAVCSNAFEPTISPELFGRAQAEFTRFTHNLTDEQLLERLKPLLAQHGRLSIKLIERSRCCPGATTYHTRFGSMLNVYRRLGYATPELCAHVTSRQRSLLVRSSIISNLMEAFPAAIQVVRKSGRCRPLLRYRRTGLLIAIVVARYCKGKRGDSWRIDAPQNERKRAAIVAFLDADNAAIGSLRVFPRLRFSRLTVRVGTSSEWVCSGQLLERTSDFLKVLHLIRNRPIGMTGH